MGIAAFLDELLEQKEYHRCLVAAEQLLMAPGHSLEDLIEINLVICRARLNLRDPSLAVASAMLAKKLACDTKAYHLLGKVYYTLTATMYYTNQFERAVATCYEYFEAVPMSHRIPAEEGMIWHALCGIYGEKQFEYQKAVEAGIRAVRCLEQARDPHNVLRTASVIVWNCIQMREFGLARDWIRRCMNTARTMPKDHWAQQVILLRRAQLAFAEGKMEQATVLAHRAVRLNYGHGFEDLQFDAMMLLHSVCYGLGEYKDALGYALSARVAALGARLYWREFEAAEAMIKTIQAAGNDIVVQLDQEYLQTGVDLTRYVSESILKSRN